MIRTLTLALVLAACGGNKPAPAPAEHHMEGEHAEHEAMSAEMSQFHDVLAPRWHAEKGPQRMKDTCSVMAEFHADADALAKSAPPAATKQDTWSTSTHALVDAVAGLDETCRANDATKFEAA